MNPILRLNSDPPAAILPPSFHSFLPFPVPSRKLPIILNRRSILQLHHFRPFHTSVVRICLIVRFPDQAHLRSLAALPCFRRRLHRRLLLFLVCFRTLGFFGSFVAPVRDRVPNFPFVTCFHEANVLSFHVHTSCATTFPIPNYPCCKTAHVISRFQIVDDSIVFIRAVCAESVPALQDIVVSPEPSKPRFDPSPLVELVLLVVTIVSSSTYLIDLLII